MFSAVVGRSEIRSIVFRMLVVTSRDNSMPSIAEGDGENSRGVGAMSDGSVKGLPGLSTIPRVEDSRRFASRGEPDVGVKSRGRKASFAYGLSRRRWPDLRPCIQRAPSRDDRVLGKYRDAGVAGGKAPSPSIASGRLFGESARQCSPSSVSSNSNFNFRGRRGLDRQDHAVRAVPEDHRIEKSLGVGVLEL